MEDELDYQDNPQLANWSQLEKNRDIFTGDVESEIQYKPVRLGKTGYTGGPYISISGDFHYMTSGGWDAKKKVTRGSATATHSEATSATNVRATGMMRRRSARPANLVDAVSLGTVHGAKGLEWPVVFLPSLVE